MTTVYHVMPMMTSSSVVIVLIVIIVIFALVGYACVRVGDDEPYTNRADEMRMLSMRSSKDSFGAVLRTIRWSMEVNAKMGLYDCYKHAGAYYCNDGELHYITVPMLKQIGDIMEHDGFNVEYIDDDVIRISW